jgi:MFS-type transporter involved in bile tolerance (Atg22 family)
VLVLFIGLTGETGLLGITPDNALNVRLSFAFAGVWAILFALPVFDPRRFVMQSFSQKTLYSIGGPRIITFFVNFTYSN